MTSYIFVIHPVPTVQIGERAEPGLLYARPCVVCGTEFRPPRKSGRPPAVCSDFCRRKQQRKWDRGVSPEVKAKRADRKAQKKKEQNRARQRRFQANVTSRGNKVGAKEKQERQDKFIALIEEGKTRRETEEIVGVAHSTVDQWLHREAEFRGRYERAREKASGEFVAPVVPFDAGFRQRYFDHSTPPHMQNLIEVINEQVALAEKEQRRDRRVLILLPPEHGKSTLCVEEYIAYRVAIDPSFRASVVCATQGKARKRLGAIERMLTDRHSYHDLIDVYGPFRSEHREDSKPWTADYFMHLRAPAAQRDYTCQALGWTGDIYGDRMDMIVFDDIATLKNQTPAEIEKMWEKTWGECRSRIRKGGLFLVIGTRMREGDIYSVMEEKGFFTDSVVMPAIQREPGTFSDEDPGEALWEDGTSLSELLALREDDLRMFELMYQQNPLPSVGAVFTYEMLTSCYDDDRYIGHVPENSVVVAGVDPSVKNYTAGVVFALTQTDSGEWYRYLVDVRNETGLTGEGRDNHKGVTDFIVDLCHDYRVNTLCVEDGAWMSLINNSFTLHSKLYALGVTHHGVKATEQSTGSEAIRALSGLFTHSLISLPGSPSSKQSLATMFHQFLTWKDERQHWRKAFDILKAFRMAEHAVQMMIHSSKGPIKSVAGHDVPKWMVA